MKKEGKLKEKPVSNLYSVEGTTSGRPLSGSSGEMSSPLSNASLSPLITLGGWAIKQINVFLGVSRRARSHTVTVGQPSLRSRVILIGIQRWEDSREDSMIIIRLSLASFVHL